ncbi:lipopolysaccharide biosynthesis protein [Paracnuella aquatica]|uniref:lipopolysaccharide biosynthesis protein n=1 Tax=Paracnuella aquatica TaxID=2268757 RepID=UPI000DEF8D38|nr:polysaccharide biosynthesis C-terminal domain-containing protein [Paracnuella aquatica]RPD46631.1 lipopolysaccharide biosynthesis protein [Paracnuella aquatica]
MSTIRRQSILSSIVVYLGFVLGFVNTFLFTREGSFSTEEYGLVQAFVAFGNILASCATLGMPAYISKFFPYYNDRLPPNKNEMLTVALLIATAGYGVVLLLGVLFKDVVLQRFDNAPLLQHYYYWIFPFGYGITVFNILEAYSWHLKLPVVTNFLKEFVFRLVTTVLIIASTVALLFSFQGFVPIYSFSYLLIALGLLAWLLATKRVAFVFSISNVSRRFKKKILLLCTFVWSGGLIFNFAGSFDTIIITAVLPNGLAAAGIFSLAQNISSLIQAPQRAMISATIGPLSQSWKDKDLDRIQRIYQRSSINMLLFSTAMFSLIWLNFEDGVLTFNLKQEYLSAKTAFFFLGLAKVIDMGTGVNGQIIATSTMWRFDFFSGMILLGLMFPLSFILTRSLGVEGPAIANLISFTVYNTVRYTFLYRKHGMQPFNRATVITLLLAAVCFVIPYFLFRDQLGLAALFLRSSVFIVLFAAGTTALKLTPDLEPVMQTVRKRLTRK